jgi:glycosyltransferase involved in cell wall biosynthesis
MTYEVSPLISVIIPTYNHGRYLGRALQSVLDQTYTNWEVLVIDNYSADNTDEVMAGFASPRIKYLKIHNNGVIAASRNAGIRAAKGDWIAFLDSDDWWTSDKLKICINIKGGDVDLIYHDLEIVSDEPSLFGNKKIRSWQVKKPVLTNLLIRGNTIATSSVVVRARLLKLIGGMNENPEMIAAEDYNTWLRIARITDNFKYVRKNLGFYQVNNQGISSRKDMSVPARKASEEFVSLLNSLEYAKHMSILNYNKARYFYLNRNHKEAEKFLLYVVRYSQPGCLVKSAWMLLKIYLAMIFNSVKKSR